MEIQSMESVKELKPGFVRASVISGKNMVLLFQVDKNVILENHKHPHLQFGYCFSGKFRFNVNGTETVVKPGDSYLIDTNIEHSAVALTDYYSMDIKIISDSSLKQDVTYTVMSRMEEFENYEILKSDIGNSNIYQIRTLNRNSTVPLKGFDLECAYFMVNKKTKIIGEDGMDYMVEPMKIYTLLPEETKNIIICDARIELFIVEIR